MKNNINELQNSYVMTTWMTIDIRIANFKSKTQLKSAQLIPLFEALCYI